MLADVNHDGLILRNIKFLYRNATTGFDGLTINLQKGNTLGVLGPSGAGKSTLLRIIAGHVQPTAGSIFVDGIEITKKPAADRPTATVFQEYNLFPHLNVRDNIFFGHRLKRQRENSSLNEGYVDRLIERFGLRGLVFKHPRELSGGQMQRVAIVRALAINPKVLLLDEPFSALDIDLRMEARNTVNSVAAEFNMTIVIVSHDQSELLACSDHVLVLDDFDAKQVGTVDALINTPANERVVRRVDGFRYFDHETPPFWCHVSNISMTRTPTSCSATVKRVCRHVYYLEVGVSVGGREHALPWLTAGLPPALGETVYLEFSAKSSF